MNPVVHQAVPILPDVPAELILSLTDAAVPVSGAQPVVHILLIRPVNTAVLPHVLAALLAKHVTQQSVLNLVQQNLTM